MSAHAIAIDVGTTVFSEFSAGYGSLVLCADPSDADACALAGRLGMAWEAGELPEFAGAFSSHRRSVEETGGGLCHELAFEFAYSTLVGAGGSRELARPWRWCLADTSTVGLHSWIERNGVGFSPVGLATPDDGEVAQAVIVRRAADLRREFGVRGRAEERSFDEVGRWLAGCFPTLFRQPSIARWLASTQARLKPMVREVA